MLTRLDQVQVAVADLEAATAEVVRLLGRRPSWVGERPGQGIREVLFRLPNTTLALLAPDGESPGVLADEVRAQLAQGPGLFALVFATDDLAAAGPRLAEAGLEPAHDPDGLARDVDSGAFRRWQAWALSAARTRGVRIVVAQYEGPDDLLPEAAALGDETASVSGLDHVVVRTADAEATRSLYGDGLGLRLALDRSFPKWGARLLFFRVGGLTVEVAASLGDQEAPGLGVEEPPRTEDDLWGLSWRFPDAGRAQARLADAGVPVSEVRAGRKPGTRVFSVHGEPLGVATLALEPPA